MPETPTGIDCIIVEDHLPSAVLVQELLEFAGHRVIAHARRYREARDLLVKIKQESDFNPQVVILDCQLPDHDEAGIELAPMFQELGIYVIAYTQRECTYGDFDSQKDHEAVVNQVNQL